MSVSGRSIVQREEEAAIRGTYSTFSKLVGVDAPCGRRGGGARPGGGGDRDASTRRPAGSRQKGRRRVARACAGFTFICDSGPRAGGQRAPAPAAGVPPVRALGSAVSDAARGRRRAAPTAAGGRAPPPTRAARARGLSAQLYISLLAASTSATRPSVPNSPLSSPFQSALWSSAGRTFTEMPRYKLAQVKCEPISDEEETLQNPQLPIGFEAGHIKLEPTFESEHCVVSIAHGNNSNSVPSHLLQHLQQPSDGLEELTPLAPTATPVCVKPDPDEPAAQLETLESTPHTLSVSLRQSMGRQALLNGTGAVEFAPLLPIKEEPIDDGDQQHFSGEDTNDSCGGGCGGGPESAKSAPKSWTQQDMENALDALRNHNMSLTKASARYGIPSTTLWQRAHRLGIDTPKKEGTAKSWNEADLRGALHALRAGAISANKASKAYGIPSSTLYKIARREGIRLAAPFNAAPTSWRPSDLERALHSIRCGISSVQRASTQYGIPTGTLYGRCKREGIELSRSSPAPWSEDAMGEALEAVRVGHMSINQAAIHYNLPYSSLYGRFKRIKCQPQISQAVHQCPVQHEGIDADHHNLESYQQYAPHHLPHSFHQHDPHFQNMEPGTFDMAQVNSHLHVNQYHDAAQLEPCTGVYYSSQNGIATS